MSEELKYVDPMVLTLNQVMVLLLTILAFTFNLRWLVAVVAVVMLPGTRFGVPDLCISRYLLHPLEPAKARILLDELEPHGSSLIDPPGHPRRVSPGATTSEKLIQQLREIIV